jgi:hypothetical protein
MIAVDDVTVVVIVFVVVVILEEECGGRGGSWRWRRLGGVVVVVVVVVVAALSRWCMWALSLSRVRWRAVLVVVGRWLRLSILLFVCLWWWRLWLWCDGVY